MEILKEKPCNKCGIIDRFPSGGCRTCCKLSVKKYKEENPDKYAETKRKWRQKNKEKCVQYSQKFRGKNIEKLKKYDKEYQEKNKERFKQLAKIYKLNNVDHVKELIRNKNNRRKNYTKEWNEKNKDKLYKYSLKCRIKNPEPSRNASRNRRAKKRTTGTLSKDISKKLLTLQKGKCACCGKQLGNNYHLDHIMPLCLGGSNTDDNVQLLTQKCNLKKSGKHPIDYMQSKGFLL